MAAAEQEISHILARLESVPFSRWHKRLLLVGALGIFFDATDFAMFGAALPPIAREFGLDPQQAGLLATVGLAGAFVGALFWGSISDYIGRRTAFRATVGIFSLFTGLMGLAWNTISLGTSRFIANFGLGGEVPVTTTLVAEFMPRDIRGRTAAGMISAFGLGQVCAALLGLLIVPSLGWRPLLFIGIVPAALLWYARRSVPESVRYLLSKGRLDEAAGIVDTIERAAGVRAVVNKTETTEVAFGISVARRSSFTVAELLSPQLRRRTILLWVVSIGLLWASNGVIFMLPTILTQRGMSIGQALSFSLVQAIFGVFGYLACAFLMDRYDRRAVLTAFFIVGAAFHVFFALASGPWMYVAIAAVGFTNPGVFGGSVIYANELYPTRVRATGAGWYFGIGRVGSFAAPFIIGAMMVSSLRGYVLYTFALSYLIAGIALFAINIETRGRALDTV